MKTWLLNKYFLAFLLVSLSVLSIFIGIDDLDLFDSESDINLLFLSRIPRLMSILVVGASLSVCGVVMQQLSANPFVSPSTSSITEWAKLGILVAILMIPTRALSLKR